MLSNVMGRSQKATSGPLGATITDAFRETQQLQTSGPEIIKHFSCSTQLSMKFFLLINVKIPTIVGILTFMSGKNSTLGLSEPKKAEFLNMFILTCK